jgi:hypothetical protein
MGMDQAYGHSVAMRQPAAEEKRPRAGERTAVESIIFPPEE